MTPTVSLLVAVYNTGKFLARCLDSLIRQSMQEIEIIIVNDSSTDDSGDIIEAYAEQDRRIRVIRHAGNLGLGATRNTAIAAATGEYIAFIDSDDWIADDYCGRLAEQAAATGADMVTCGYFVACEADRSRDHIIDLKACTGIHKDMYIRLILEGAVAGFSWNKLYRRTLITGNNIRFVLREELEHVEDRLFSIQCLLRSGSIAFIHAPLYHHTVHAASIVGKYQPALFRNVLALDKAYTALLAGHGRYELPVCKAVLRGALSALANERKRSCAPAERHAVIRQITANDRVQAALREAGIRHWGIKAAALLFLVRRQYNALLLLLLVRRDFFHRWKVAAGTFYLLHIRYRLDALLSPLYHTGFAVYKDRPKALLTLLPTHNNLGDHAIAEASRQYLSRYFPEYTVIELQIKDTYRHAKAIRRYMCDDDLVFMLGGGNMGNRYQNEERTRRYIIRLFSRNHIIQLPQTAHFDDSEQGRRALKKARQVYNGHPHLTLIARDTSSFRFMQEQFRSCRILEHPDMVLYLAGKSGATTARAGIGLCLRKDGESAMSEAQRDDIIRFLPRSFGPVIPADTLAQTGICKEQRREALQAVWDRYRKLSVVVTDRLHAMIFCAITQTPCVVLPSFNHKVREGFEILRKLNYIRFLEQPSPAALAEAIEKLTAVAPKTHIDYDALFFSGLRALIDDCRQLSHNALYICQQ